MTEITTSPHGGCAWTRLFRVGAILVAVAILGWTGRTFLKGSAARGVLSAGDGPPLAAPELDGGIGWLNTAGPIHLKDLRGKIVLLDFWTFCCINCIHTLPDLARLEKKYANQLVVIGVHSAKFDNEKNSDSIRKAIHRYEITHPVVNDARLKIWDAYAVQGWPTLCLIDPEGNIVGQVSGEGNYEVLDREIAKLIEKYRNNKLLDETPKRFTLARFEERPDSPLFFPGKILADEATNRLFIADSTHHRIVITDLDGKKIAIAGDGRSGRVDGPFEKARFNDPQGMALDGQTLYVADRKNHQIRALDLTKGLVRTVAAPVAGQDPGGASERSPRSPWDLCRVGRTIYIAMAGRHQIWTLDLASGMLAPFAGNGHEDIVSGPASEASFAQPSGLTTDGTSLYVADSEVSAIRSIRLEGANDVSTVVGQGLFKFGDVDGVGNDVRLQHALGVAYHAGKLYVADTYNSKIKVIDPASRACKTLVGSGDGWLAGPVFSEPGGLSFAGERLFVADTNAHRIRVIVLNTLKVSTLALHGVEAPKPAAER
jgi:thiol-disulfide isomerase/thioredoxin